jgi:hypothetical protein
VTEKAAMIVGQALGMALSVSIFLVTRLVLSVTTNAPVGIRARQLLQMITDVACQVTLLVRLVRQLLVLPIAMQAALMLAWIRELIRKIQMRLVVKLVAMDKNVTGAPCRINGALF